MRKLLPRTALALTLAFSALPLFAHDHGHSEATGVVRERMDGMERMGKLEKAISDRLRDHTDLQAIAADAKAIAELTPHIAHWFPPGSMQGASQARKAIWDNWPDFERKAAAADTEARKLANTGTGDFGALQRQLRAMSGACTDCHEKYRLRRR